MNKKQLLSSVHDIVKRHRQNQQQMINGIPEFRRMRISNKVTQLEGQIKAIGEICSELEDIIEREGKDNY